MTANVIIKQVLLKRGNTAATSTYTGPIGEAVVDTDLKTLRVQDGLTAGGTLLATADSVTEVTGSITGFADGLDAANVAIAGLTANAAVQAVAISGLQTNAVNVTNSIVAANTAMKSYVDAATSLLWANAATQADNLSALTANAASQGVSLNVLNANAVTQHQSLASLLSNAAVQSQQLDLAAANAAVQSQSLDVLIANAASQGQYLDSLLSNAASQGSTLNTLIANAATQSQSLSDLWANAAAQAAVLSTSNTDVSGLWANAAVQETEISGLRANIIATNAAVITANTGMKSYVDTRTGNITFNGRTIGADSNGGQSGITFDSAGNGEIHIADFTGINNPDPEHWLHIGDGSTEAAQNTGDLAIDFNNGVDTLRGHVTWTWDWWDTSLSGYKGTHDDGSGTHARFVLLKGHDHNSPLMSFDYTSGNAIIANISGSTATFGNNVIAQNVIIGSDVKWGNGTSYLYGISNRIDAANVAAQTYVDTRITNLVNGAPAALDTLYEIANSLGNNTSLTTTLFNILSTIDSNVAAANAAIITANNAVVSYVNSQDASLRANIAAANTAIINNLSYTNQLNTNMAANVNAANAAVITANTAMKGYVDDQIGLVTGNIEFNDTTITTKAGANPTIIIDAGGEVVIRDNTGIRNENPGYWLHVGDALDSSGIPHRGQIAVDYSDGLGGANNNGHRGSVVFDYLWWNSGSDGNYNEGVGPLRRFGLFKDGILPGSYTEAYDPLFTVDLDTKIFRVNSLSTSGNIVTVGSGSFTGNVRTDGYFFANGAPLVIPPLVVTGNTAPTVGATEGALWWNNGDGRAYIKYEENWVDLSPVVLPPISRYVGNVVFSSHNITHVGNITPHLSVSYDIGSTDLRWKDFYVDTVNTTGNVVIGGNLFVYGNVTNIATTSLNIDDSLIYMANNNPGNSVDIGTVGNFNNGTYQHTGFVRDASDSTWKLFSNVVAEPSNTVDFTFAVYDDIRVGNITSPTVVDLYANIITANNAVVSHIVDLNSQMVANVNAANTAIVTANTAMNSRVTDLNSAMTANVTAANAAIVTANTAMNSRVTDLNSAMTANVTAANAAIVTANSAVVSYVNSLNSAMIANVNAANAAIITANTDMKSYVDGLISTSLDRIDAANTAIITANTGMKSYVDGLNSTSSARIDAANAAIITANTALKSYTDTQLGLKAPLANPAFTGNVTFSTPGNVTINGYATIGQNAVILGNLQVQGTTTTVNQTSLTLTDKFITLANNATNSSMANGGGLFVAGANANVLYSSVSDSWTLNKSLAFTDYFNFTGANLIQGNVIRPAAGSGTAGIMFPDNPGGGTGDAASIKYYVVSGEQTVLEIKTTNDSNDDIWLNSTGNVKVINNLAVDGASILKGVSEAFSAKSSATGVVTHDCSAGTIFYHTSPSANFTVNATNLKCDAGYTASITAVISQGATPYLPTALQIAGVAQTINWANGSAPTGNANKKDVVSFSILNSSGTYIVLGQMVTFG